MDKLEARSALGLAELLELLLRVVAVFLTTAMAPSFALSADPGLAGVDHSLWDELLQRYVDKKGTVAYRKLASEGRAQLGVYLDRLAKAHPGRMNERDRIAFWINAYNAGIVAGVLRGHSPESALSRLRFFRWYRFSVAGRDRTTNEIEHEILRKRFHDPRIHFALVCASTSCPKLRREAYRGDDLDRQLDDQARSFINDPGRNRIDTATGVVELSPLFDWFGADFSAVFGSVSEFVARYVEEPAQAALVRAQGDHLRFLDYDWTLNAQREGSPQLGSAEPKERSYPSGSAPKPERARAGKSS